MYPEQNFTQTPENRNFFTNKIFIIISWGLVVVLIGIAIFQAIKINQYQAIINDEYVIDEGEDYEDNTVYDDDESSLLDFINNEGHTSDPNLITTYLPHAEIRNLGDPEKQSLYYYMDMDQTEPNTINVMVEDCDEEQDKIRAQEYLNTIPMDLSGYKIIYSVTDEDSYCGD